MVRVYANSRTPVPTAALGRRLRVPMLLYGFRDGRRLPDGPLESDSGPAKLGVGDLRQVTGAQRLAPRAAYTFTLPWSWADRTISLRAIVNPPGCSRDCTSAGLAPRITPSRFRACASATRRICTSCRSRSRVDGQYADAYPLPDPAFAKAKAVMPLSLDLGPLRRGTRLQRYSAHHRGEDLRLLLDRLHLRIPATPKRSQAFKRLRPTRPALGNGQSATNRETTNNTSSGSVPRAVGGVTNTDQGSGLRGPRALPAYVCGGG